MSRSARSALNFAVSSVASVVSVSIGFVVTPLLLRWLGEDRLGAFRVSLDWIGFLTLLELGTGAALGPLLLKARTSGPSHQETAMLAAGLRRYCFVGFLTLVAGAALVAVLPSVTNTPESLWNELWIGAGLYVLITSLTFPLMVYRPLAEASQKGYLVSSLIMMQGILIALVGASAAFMGWGLIGQFGAASVGMIAFTCGMMLLLRREAPLSRMIRPEVDLIEARREMKSLSRLTLLQSLLSRITLFLDNIVVSLFLGPAAVAAFFLTQRLMQISTAQLQSVGGATWAGLCELYQMGHHDLFRQRLRELTKITATLAAMIVVPLAVLTKPFVELWVGSKQYAGDAVAILAVVNAICLPIFSLWGWVFNGIGRTHRILPYLVISAVLTLSFSLVATWQLGIVGPVLATAIVNLTWNLWWLPRLLNSDFQIPVGQLQQTMFVPLLPAVAMLLPMYELQKAWPDYSWLRLAAEFGAVVSVQLFLSWMLILTPIERQHFRLLAARIRTRLKPSSERGEA